MFRRLFDEERGAVSIEFAITIPAVLLMLAVVLTGLYLGATKITLSLVAADTARLESRGEIGDKVLANLPVATEIAREEKGDFHCVNLTVSETKFLGTMQVSAMSCALRTDISE